MVFISQVRRDQKVPANLLVEAVATIWFGKRIESCRRQHMVCPANFRADGMVDKSKLSCYTPMYGMTDTVIFMKHCLGSQVPVRGGPFKKGMFAFYDPELDTGASIKLGNMKPPELSELWVDKNLHTGQWSVAQSHEPKGNSSLKESVGKEFAARQRAAETMMGPAQLESSAFAEDVAKKRRRDSMTKARTAANARMAEVELERVIVAD